MVKHTQTIRQQFADELFQCVWPFCGIGAESVNKGQAMTDHFVVSDVPCQINDVIMELLEYRQVLGLGNSKLY